MAEGNEKNPFEQLEYVELRELVRYLVEKSGKSASQVSRDAGRKGGYIGTVVNRGTVPGLAALADIAEACGYVLELRSADEVISVLPLNALQRLGEVDTWGSEVIRLALGREGDRRHHVVTGERVGEKAMRLRGLAALLPEGITIDDMIGCGAHYYRIDDRGFLVVKNVDGDTVAMFPARLADDLGSDAGELLDPLRVGRHSVRVDHRVTTQPTGE